MALSFPAAPAPGQQYVGDGVTYEWDNTLGAWVKLKSVQSALLGAAAQTGAAIIPGGDDTERAAITTPAAGMLRYNDQAGIPAVMEYYDGIAWKTLSTGGGGGIVGQDWDLVSMPYPVKNIRAFATHPVTLKFGALCQEYSGQYRVYESSDGVSWTRGSFNLGTNPGTFLKQGRGNGWIAGIPVKQVPFPQTPTTGAYYLPDLVTAPTLYVAPTGLPGANVWPADVAYVPSTDQYIVFYNWQVGAADIEIRGYKSPDFTNWTQTYSASWTSGQIDGRDNGFGVEYPGVGGGYAISGNTIWPSFGVKSTNAATQTLNVWPTSSDGGNTWTNNPFLVGSNNAILSTNYWYFDGVWLLQNASNQTVTQSSYALSVAAPASFPNIAYLNPPTVTASLSGLGNGYFPDLALFPTTFSSVVFPGSVPGTFDIRAATHSKAVNTSIAISNNYSAYYYISR